MSDPTPTPDYQAAARFVNEDDIVSGATGTWKPEWSLPFVKKVVDAALEGLVVLPAGDYYEIIHEHDHPMSMMDSYKCDECGALAVPTPSGKFGLQWLVQVNPKEEE